MVCRWFVANTYSRLLLSLLTVLLIGISAHAQLLDTRVTLDLGPGSLDKCLLQLQQASGLPFAYETTGLRNFPVGAKSFQDEKLSVVLRYLLKGTGFHFEEKHKVILIGPAEREERNPGADRLFKGVIEDKETGERLQGVTILDPEHQNGGTFTDKDGYFSIPAISDTLKLRLSYMSYKPVEIVLHGVNAPMIKIKMDVAHEGLDSILVVASSDITPFSPLSRIKLSFSELSFLPRFAGDVDLLSMVKTAPGIQEAYDGSGSLIVRGGSPDQNLLLLDDVNIYGATHLFGLLSSVSSRAVKDINIYKGAFPARYGGRISSVWDITLKSGDLEHYHGSVSVGTMAADFSLEGPIVKNKTTFSIAGRRSYHDYYVRLFTPGLNFYFQDLSFKLRHRFSDKDQIFLSGYISQDRFKLTSDSIQIAEGQYLKQTIQMNTENRAAVFRWQHNYSGALTSNLSISYSAYKLAISNQYNNVSQLVDTVYVRRGNERITTGVSDLTAKFQARYAPGGKHEFEAGIFYMRHNFDPHSIRQIITVDYTPQRPFIFVPTVLQDIVNDNGVNEAGFFAEDNMMLSPKLRLSAGLHFNRYFYEKVSYSSLQPRFNMRYQFNEKWSANLAYARMQQALHRLSRSQTSLPADFWIPSSDTIKPQISNQVSLGLNGQIFNGLLDLCIESYYKDSRNVTEYLTFRRVTSVSSYGSWASRVATGDGEAYGVEFSLRKSKGKYRGWLSYALSWSTRTLPDVNYGQTFLYKYDRRHNLNLVNTYKFNKHLELTAVFSFQSKPKPPTLIIRTADLPWYDKEVRAFIATTDLRAYHRLDLGVNWLSQFKEGVTGVLNLSVLNVYNRQNPFFYFVSNTDAQLSGTSLLPIAISLAYTLNF
ncbi:TonB-dependent receptor [Taibaiella chishuiensis]|uniref:Outer membrane receptor protein involved in Fe transport n=1 Tax=Taibaiella chishuiensis TaxID=1434707 RepID=A0A2P8D7R2_9BACT|nr:TonB-dependent receptor [Taibaiella chishuiensis]PSK93253.1 outer membrane receptor protein involved in Fe transport [Taibaiella chishuiensis]